MKENKKSFVLYADLIETAKALNNTQKAELLMTILNFANGNEIDISDPVVKIAFIPIRQQMLRDEVKWEKIKLKRAEAGKKGGRPKKEDKKQSKAKKANGFSEKLKKQSKAKKAVTVNDTVTVTVTDTDTVNDNVTVRECTYSPEFLKFWKLYPRKEAKGKAYDAWNKIKIPKPSIDELRISIENYQKTEQWKENKKFIPHPTTYLNQRRWEDEPEINNQNQKNNDNPPWYNQDQINEWAQNMEDTG